MNSDPSAVWLTAEWAVEGKPPGSVEDYQILKHSKGPLLHEDFTQIIARFSTGTPELLPQVTIAWVGDKANTRLILAIHRWTGYDGRGRRIATSRYFSVLYHWAAEYHLSYEALFHALDGSAPPSDDLVEFAVQPHLATVGDTIRATAMGTAALLLTGRHVCVLEGGALSMDDRLRFLDAVAAFLPYGMRTRLTASTWSSSASTDKIRLSFASHPGSDKVIPIVWGEPVSPSYLPEHAQTYLDLLTHHPDPAELIVRLAMERDPLTFKPEGCAGAVEVLENICVSTGRGYGEYAVRLHKVERTLTRYADAAGNGWLSEMNTAVGQLIDLKWSAEDFFDAERRRYRKLIRDRRLLASRPPEGMRADVYAVLLTVGYGQALGPEDVEEILTDVPEPSLELIAALSSMEPAVVRSLPRLLSKEAMEGAFAFMQTGTLAEVAAEEGQATWLMALACNELVARGSGGRQDPCIAEALNAHDYLIDVIRELHPPESAHHRFTGHRVMLQAAYGDALDGDELKEIFSRVLVPGAGPLIAAASSLYGSGAGRVLLDAAFHQVEKTPLPAGVLDAVKGDLLKPELAGAPPKLPWPSALHRGIRRFLRRGRRPARSSRSGDGKSSWMSPAMVYTLRAIAISIVVFVIALGVGYLIAQAL
ncbi:hypothetical protein [Sinosporangium siamense]|uniref:Uncharacterized protein n=1 Tax=Sinosporangium siamense TaxID=1367973 RepID=A0A919RDT4_9ACTN|nr:hypothetical protein [Sinosporangium siamense]GII90584.1 hypothetical protein Ssi02_08150 [Sinosporangium siamense]